MRPKNKQTIFFIINKPIGLPAELQALGNNYVRDEFKRHKNCNNAEAKVFMVEWTNYAVQMSQQLGLGIHGKPKGEIGAHLKVEDLNKFKEDQIVQLYELLKAATGSDDHSITNTENKLDEPDDNQHRKP